MNIAKILENVPNGTKLYSTVFGDVEFLYVNYELEHPIKVKTCSNLCEYFDKEGKYNINYPDSECVLFPSRENRDWSKFQIEEPYEFKPFEPVLVRNEVSNKWKCDYFSHITKTNDNCYYYICVSNIWKYCIPYNNNTKHLVGTTGDFI